MLGLDTKKSAAQINSDLKKLQKQLSQVKFNVALDSSLDDADKKLKNAENSLQELGKLGVAFKDQMSQAAESAGDMTAALGTMIDTTHRSGSETADAFRSILLYIRQITDESAGIDAEVLAKYEAACNALNAKLEETKNGILSLRETMTVLEELAAAYNSLDENDSHRTALLDSVDSVPGAAQLDALLSRWDTYKSMLQQYADGTGSIAGIKNAGRVKRNPLLSNMPVTV